ncbi:MAG: hypothetical protein JSS77_13045 [Acidobacteria bacterium]|nr:hypothetical protein [Acidobacteriota bacterium]
MNSNVTRKALVEVLLPQQVPDAEVLSKAGLKCFGLLTDTPIRLPNVIAYSQEHGALFFIDDGAMGATRLAELKAWSDAVDCRRVFVSVFHSRKAYAKRMDVQAANTFAWFMEEPKHTMFISGSPEASAEFLGARFAVG